MSRHNWSPLFLPYEGKICHGKCVILKYFNSLTVIGLVEVKQYVLGNVVLTILYWQCSNESWLFCVCYLSTVGFQKTQHQRGRSTSIVNNNQTKYQLADLRYHKLLIKMNKFCWDTEFNKWTTIIAVHNLHAVSWMCANTWELMDPTKSWPVLSHTELLFTISWH